MAKGGKHLNKGSKSRRKSKSSYNGKHLSESYKYQVRRSSENKSRRRHRLPAVAPFAIVMMLFCFIMISPIKGCIISGENYIGIAAAQSIALENSGISANAADNMLSDMIVIDGEVYYKVQFTDPTTDYRYIIDAVNGEIVMQNLYNINIEE